MIFQFPAYTHASVSVNLYLINSKKLQIGIGIGKFSEINSEELQLNTVWLSQRNYKFSCFRSFWGRPPRKTGGGWARGSKRSIFLTIENNGLHIKFSRILPCMLCNVLLCKGVLSKGFEEVPVQHKQSYRFQDLARDSADPIFGHCEAHWAPYKILQLPGFVCSVHLKNVHCALKAL